MKSTGFEAAVVMIALLLAGLYILPRRRSTEVRRVSVMNVLAFAALCSLWLLQLPFTPIRVAHPESLSLPDDLVIFGVWLLFGAVYLKFKCLHALLVHSCGLVFYAACLAFANFRGATIEPAKAAWFASIGCFAGSFVSVPIYTLASFGVLGRRARKREDSAAEEDREEKGTRPHTGDSGANG